MRGRTWAPSLATDERFATSNARVANRPVMDVEIERVLHSSTLAGLKAKLNEAGIAYGPVNAVAGGVSRHPQLRRWLMMVAGAEISRVAGSFLGSVDDGGGREVSGLDEHTEVIGAESPA